MKSESEHEWVEGDDRFRIAKNHSILRPLSTEVYFEGAWITVSCGAPAREILRLRGLLEQVSEYLHDDPDDRGDLHDLCRRIRQALRREEGERS